MFLALLGVHAALAGAAPLLARRLGRGVFLACGLAPLATVVAATARAPAILAGRPVVESLAWAPSVGVAIDLRVDGFALLMIALVSGIGTLIFGYAARYFGPRSDLGPFAGILLAFSGAMLGLVLADNLLLLYVCWELTSITSYILIGFENEKGSARAAALQALLITSAGGLAMLGGFVLLGQAAGTYQISALLADPPSGALATAGVFLALLGAFTKSAQAPFHSWLPSAMIAPTPVSAYLHSATMVKAGVYLVARLAPAFALVAGWRPLLVGVGVATMLLGGYRALRQHDLKLVLAYGTISQLGLLMTLLGAGTAEATLAGCLLLLAHGAFKATLFMVVGVVDHQAHTRDLRQLSGLGRRLPALAAVAAVAAASMAGLPPLLGFIAKEAAYESLLHGGLGVVGPIALVGIVAGSVLTFAYSARFLWGAFATKGAPADRGLVGCEVPRPAATFVMPAGLLAVVTVMFGLWPAGLDALVNAAAMALDPRVEVERLALWHGFSPALGLSALTVALGVAAFALRGRLERMQERLGGLPGSAEAYAGSLTGLNRIADRSTAIFQTGSLPTYLGVIAVLLVGLPATALIGRAPLASPTVLAESPVQLAVAAAIVGSAVALMFVRHRFSGVLVLGSIGYGVALLFVIQGAPDLALTQLLVETLSVVVFVLVLRHLPDRFSTPRLPGSQLARAAVAGFVGVSVASFALVAGGAVHGPSVAEQLLARSYTEGGGRNVVNVVLVDIRGIDTFGEITVLLTAALGISMLVLATRPPPSAAEEPRAEVGAGAPGHGVDR